MTLSSPHTGRSTATAAAGSPPGTLPASRVQSPFRTDAGGYVGASLDRRRKAGSDVRGPAIARPIAQDLVVLSHLRWDWVWQRPQHLVTRFAADRAVRGARTWFVEEPLAADIPIAVLQTERIDGIERVRLLVPEDLQLSGARGFGDHAAGLYGAMLRELLAADGVTAPDVLVYTPVALPLAQAIRPHTIAYDVMDDLASFADAPAAMRLRQAELLGTADVVFAGGRSLHRSIAQRRADCHLFPSGVDVAHYDRARLLRTVRDDTRPVAGYVGVLDERLDLELVGALAAALPDWVIRMVGPVTKIDPAALPTSPNIEYAGKVDYDLLPEVMAGLDVALMPFARNDATRSISPTKTPEYLAAGLPVVSTRVADVVADYSEVVRFADDGRAFAEQCRAALAAPPAEGHAEAVRVITRRQSWDVIAASMAQLMESPSARDRALHRAVPLVPARADAVGHSARVAALP